MVMKMRLFLFPIVLFGLITGVLNATSTTESVIWLIVGIAGLIGVATLGMSSNQVVKTVKDIF